MEGKYGPMALPTAMSSVVRSGRNFTSTTSKRHQAPEKTRFIYFQSQIRRASAVLAVEAKGDIHEVAIDGPTSAIADLGDAQLDADTYGFEYR